MEPFRKSSLQQALQPPSPAFLKTFNFSRVFQIACLGCTDALFQRSIKYHCGPAEMTVWSSIALLRPNCPFHQCGVHSGERRDRRQEGSVLKTWVGAEGEGALTLINLLPADAEEACRAALCLADEDHRSLWSSFNLLLLLQRHLPPQHSSRSLTRFLPGAS